jgi:hypothetical protein
MTLMGIRTGPAHVKNRVPARRCPEIHLLGRVISAGRPDPDPPATLVVQQGAEHTGRVEPGKQDQSTEPSVVRLTRGDEDRPLCWCKHGYRVAICPSPAKAVLGDVDVRVEVNAPMPDRPDSAQAGLARGFRLRR